MMFSLECCYQRHDMNEVCFPVYSMYEPVLTIKEIKALYSMSVRLGGRNLSSTSTKQNILVRLMDILICDSDKLFHYENNVLLLLVQHRPSWNCLNSFKTTIGI